MKPVHEIDIVELTAPAGDAEVGARGTVVSTSDDTYALVEMADRDGHLVEARYDDLVVVKPYRAPVSA